ncbi:hypothetical protein F8388_026106 [Cannabis sativa]|uniref:DUF4283 domain-containing protein n=1 Tax=Cannabis sativa TaxID=3483 RepID=A0A7J6FZZ5_CANSA|nr:hypothetical protein F8388_026106 [Cannabis sativa]KAF4397776.1 hypothetical protein G4B88_017257 [Cannabis sativa]
MMIVLMYMLILMATMGPPVGEWSVKKLGTEGDDTFFQVKFSNQHDSKLALEKQPWLVNGGLLLLEGWPSSGLWKDTRLDKVSCWVRLRGFLLKAFTKNNVMRIGEMAGMVEELRWSSTQQILFNGYVQLRINFPIKESIFVGWFITVAGKKH